MRNAPSDSVLAKKLNAFIALSGAELKCLADMQLNPRQSKAGPAADPRGSNRP